jgi:hypothetical protein
MISEKMQHALKGRLQVSNSAYKSPYDFAHDFHIEGIGFLIIYQIPIRTICKRISVKINPKFNSKPP